MKLQLLHSVFFVICVACQSTQPTGRAPAGETTSGEPYTIDLYQNDETQKERPTSRKFHPIEGQWSWVGYECNGERFDRENSHNVERTDLSFIQGVRTANVYMQTKGRTCLFENVNTYEIDDDTLVVKRGTQFRKCPGEAKRENVQSQTGGSRMKFLLRTGADGQQELLIDMGLSQMQTCGSRFSWYIYRQLLTN